MKKIIILATLCLFAFNGCRFLTARGRSVNKAEKLIEEGDFYQSTIILGDVLLKNYDYGPALELFPSTFQNALNENTKNFDMFKNKNVYLKRAESSDKILNLYKTLAKIPNKSLSLMNIEKDYKSMELWTKNTAESYYLAGENTYSTPQSLNEYIEKSKLYKKSYVLMPNYKDSKEMYEKYKELGMKNIVFFNQNYTYSYMDVSSMITNQIMQNFNEKIEFIEYANIQNGSSKGLSKDYSILSKDFNRFINIEIVNFDYSYPKTNRRHYTKYYYEKIKEVNGIKTSEIVDYIPSTSEKGVTYVKHSYTKTKNTKNTRAIISIQFTLYDLKNNKLIKKGYINKNVNDSCTWYTYSNHPQKFDEFEFEIKDKYSLIEELCSESSRLLSKEIINNI